MLSLMLGIAASVQMGTVSVENYHAVHSNVIRRYKIYKSRNITPQSTSRTSVDLKPKTTQKKKPLNLPWDGHFSAKNFTTSTDRIDLEGIKGALKASILMLPKNHTGTLKELEIRNVTHVSRGLANSKKIILHTDSVETEAELKSVFVHEMGHIVDLGYLKGQNGNVSTFKDGRRVIYTDDPSLIFYTISWQDEKTRKKGTLRNDFVSGYAMQSPFEDFAESYIFYRLHGEKFRKIAKESDALDQKYNFMKYQVFAGVEFQKEKNGKFLHNLIWDATLVKS